MGVKYLHSQATSAGLRWHLLSLVFQPVGVPLWLPQLLQLCVVRVDHMSGFSLPPQPLQSSHIHTEDVGQQQPHAAPAAAPHARVVASAR